ncbi:hypothetical protein [Agrobacterium vaccinii]|uniref:hypothetical protein n=1 Tax=Agrobacterium vaccinii TaxID=2735528 RepID=UPI001E46071C|nr:hypothetical protein [Agrobacterium vaccinii]UHS58564.1 hypothetical protein HRS00_16800 [Agrobacterium vaccinii]
MLLISKYSALILTYFVAVNAVAASPESPPTNAPPVVETTLCDRDVTVQCLVAEIEAHLGPDIDPFKRERITLALAQAKLAAGNVDQALLLYKELGQGTTKAQFLITLSKKLLKDGNVEAAKTRLGEANDVLNKGQSEFDRLSVTGLNQRLAETLAEAGLKDEARALLIEIADFRKKIRPNPMLLGLMFQVGQTQNEIGFSEDAAITIKDSYERALDQEIEMTPDLALRLFQIWASIDATSATKAAEELVAVVKKDGASAFEFAIWTGLVSGLGPSGQPQFREYAQSAFKSAPERAAVMGILPMFSAALNTSGQRDQALASLQEGRTEAAALSGIEEKKSALFAVAKGFSGIDANEDALALIDEILTLEKNQPYDMGFSAAMMSIPAELAVLGRVDQAYELATGISNGRELVLMHAADRLATKGEYEAALRFVREIDDEMAAMIMAGMAARMQGISVQPTTP